MKIHVWQNNTWVIVNALKKGDGLPAKLFEILDAKEQVPLLSSFAVGNARWMEVEPGDGGLKVTQSFTDPAVSPSARSIAAFTLRSALRDHMITQMPSDIQLSGKEEEQEKWMGKLQIGRIDERASWWSAACEGASAGDAGAPAANAKANAPAAKAGGSFPKAGALALTPFGEVFVLRNLSDAKEYRACAMKARAAICNASLDWEEVGGYSQNKRFVPVLSEKQLRRELPDPRVEGTQTVWRRTPRSGRTTAYADVIISDGDGVGRSETWVKKHKDALSKANQLVDWRGRKPKRGASASGGSPAQSRIPAAALPFIEDSLVRRQVFALARPTRVEGDNGSVTLKGSAEKFVWVCSDSPVGHAFYRRQAERVLLPIGTRLYKFNGYLGLIPDWVSDDKVSSFNVSPWWSPLDGYMHGSSWEQRGDLAKLVSAMQRHASQLRQSTIGVGGMAEPIPEDGTNPLRKSLDQVGAGAILEIGRVTSVVKENWNPLRYIMAIELTQPIYAFFGDFAGMERIDLEPDVAGFSWKDPHPVGEVVRAPAKLATTLANAERQAGDVSAVEPTLQAALIKKSANKSAAAAARTGLSAGMASGAQLPGGGTQFYIPNLTRKHFQYVSKWPDRYKSYTVTGEERGKDLGAELQILDLYKADQ